LANEQAEKDRCTEAKEKLAREQQEQLTELAWINEEVSPSVQNSAFQLSQFLVRFVQRRQWSQRLGLLGPKLR